MSSTRTARVPLADNLAPASAAMVHSGALRHPLARIFQYLTTGERLYWVCQFVSWTFFFFVNYAITSAFTEMTPRLTLWLGVYMLAGLELTQRFRLHVRRAGWLELPWSRVVGRVLVSIVLMGAVHAAFTLLCTMAFSDFSLGGLGKAVTLAQLIGIAFTNTFNMSIVFGVWAGLYFAVKNIRRQRHAEMERLRLETNLKEAELRALKSQINPHFLFNSLNSLRALIDEDAPRARESVTRLANMLRYSLQSGQLETVPLEEELRIVEDYLALEQVRHENRLRVRWQVADEARGQPIPPMLLQTLVENAVKYGISTRREGGEVFIDARLDGEHLRLRVTNPGELRAPANSSAARAGSSTGVGLRNASERLKLLFGDRARLTLLPEPVGCVTAEVLIPLDTAS